MYQILNPQSTSDASPFQFARMQYLRGRVDQNFQEYVKARRLSTGRLDSNHLLRTILISLAVEFTGDLQAYVQAVDAAARRIGSGLGITSASSKGRLHTESHFYPECPEIIIYGRSQWTMMDLWKDWRTMEAVKVINHPISTLDIIELAVMNNVILERPDLAILVIDIPLLAAQWQMWNVVNPQGSMEHFITEIPLVNLMKSHLNVAFFNKVFTEIGPKRSCNVRTNLPFAQIPVEDPANSLAGEVYSSTSAKEMKPNMILASVPSIYGTTYLEDVQLPDSPPTSQILWAIQASKMDTVGFVLAFGRVAGYDKMSHELNIINRTLLRNQEDKTLVNGLSTAAASLLQERMQILVTDQMPK